MREIKFRGIRVDNNEWIYGTFIVIKNVFDEEDPEEKIMFFDSKWIAGCEAIGECWIEVKPETVGEFTGPKDKNGVEIFEGDIVETNGELFRIIDNSKTGLFQSCKYIITWVDDSWGTKIIYNSRWNSKFNKYGSLSRGLSAKHYTIIGNIHQNPSML